LGLSSFSGKSFLRSPISKASKANATNVPPMPTMSMVNPNEKLSTSISLGLLILDNFVKSNEFREKHNSTLKMDFQPN
jgi:hypothetical protein